MLDTSLGHQIMQIAASSVRDVPCLSPLSSYFLYDYCDQQYCTYAIEILET